MSVIEQAINLAQLSLQASNIFNLEEILSLSVGFFAIILVVISLISYGKTKLRMLLLVSAAFALFAIKTLIHHLNLFVFNLGAGFENVLFSVLDLLILLLFFLALVVGTKTRQETVRGSSAAE